MCRLCSLVEDRSKARMTECGEHQTLRLRELDSYLHTGCAASDQQAASPSFSFLIHKVGKPVLITLSI